MAKSEIEKGIKKTSKKAVKKAIRSSKKVVKKTVKNAKKSVKKAIKNLKKKKSTRTSVSGRKYKGLSEATRKRIEQKQSDKLVQRRTSRTKDISNLSVEQAIKRANDRLRKIEAIDPNTREDLTQDSNEYRLARKYATEQYNSKGKIYQRKKLWEEDKLRFISYSEFLKLSKEDQKYYKNVLQNFLKAGTTTKKGIKEKYEKAKDTFNATYGTELTVDQYKDFFRKFRDLVQADYANHKAYNLLVQSLEFLDIESLLTDDNLEQYLKYAYNNQWEKIPRKYRNKNYW